MSRTKRTLGLHGRPSLIGWGLDSLVLVFSPFILTRNVSFVLSSQPAVHSGPIVILRLRLRHSVPHLYHFKCVCTLSCLNTKYSAPPYQCAQGPSVADDVL